MKFIEESTEYAEDIDMFTNFWNSLGNISVYEAITLLEEKLEEIEILKIRFDRKYSSKNFWEEAKKTVFYEDIKYSLVSLKKILEGEKIFFIQCPDLPNKLVREKKLIELICKKYTFCTNIITK